MHKHIKTLAVTAAVGALGLLLASTAQAATRTWDSTKKTGNWNTASNWSDSKKPATGDTVVFPTGVSATYDMNLTGLGGLTRDSGSGTTTLSSLPAETGWLGAVTMKGGALVFGWNGEPPTNPMTSLTFTTGGTIDLGGASQELQDMPAYAGKTLTLKNGTMTTGWDQTKAFTLAIGTGAKWNLPLLRTFNYASSTWTATKQTVNVKDGGVLKVSGVSYLGDGMRDSGKEQELDINISNSGSALFGSDLYLGRQGISTVTVTNGTLEVAETLYGAMSYRPAGRTINAISELYLGDGATLKADRILYGDNAGKDGRFTFTVSGNSKVYTRTLQGVGKSGVEADHQINDVITLDGATFIPLSSSDPIFKGSEYIKKNYITIGANGLTIDNEKTNVVTIAEELRGTGSILAKMYGANFTLNNAMTTTGDVSFEDPGLITLNCAKQAFASDTTVTIKFTRAPLGTEETARLLVDWSKNGKPADVTFKLAEDSFGDYILSEDSMGLFVQPEGHEPAAVAEWKGGDDRDAYATTNWVFKNAEGEVLKNGYIGGDTVFTYGGGSPRFNVTNGTALAGHVFLLTGDVTLPATRDWTGFDTVALADGVTIDENGYKLKLGGNLMGTNDNATVSNGGDLDFTIPTGEEKLLGPITLNSVTNIFKRGPGTLTATNLTLRVKPALTLTGGKMAFDWSGQDLPTNFLASLSVPGSATLNLGGASLSADFPISDSKTFSLENGFLTTAWNAGNNDNPTRKFNIAADATWTVDGGLTAQQAIYEGHVNGGVMTVKGASVLGDWYHKRSFEIYVTDGGTLNHNEGDLTIGSAGVGLVNLNNSTLNAEGRTIKASVKTKSDKSKYNGDATLTLDKKAVLKAKAITYGDDDGTIDKENTAFTFKATGYSTLYIESLTAAGRTKDEITFSAATIVPMKSGVLIKGSTNLTSNVINIGNGGLTIDNQYTNTVTIAETLKDLSDNSGAVTFNLYGADLTITEPQLCKNIKFVNPGRIYLKGEKTTFAENTTVTIDYTDASFIKRSKIITWEATQPATLNAVLTERAQQLSGRKLVIYPEGISFKTGFTLILR